MEIVTEQELLTSKQLAKRMNLSHKTIDAMRLRGQIPSLRLSATCIRYSYDDVVAWLKTHPVRPQEQVATA